MENGCAKYDVVDYTIIVWKHGLCDEIKEKFSIELPVNEKTSISETTYMLLWNFFIRNKDWNGMLGDNFLNNW
jgi:hypothetical protein